MATLKVIFHELLQDSQDLGSDDEHVVSRIFFSVEANGRRFDNLQADIKQTVGSSYDTASLEVSSPKGGYRGPFDYDKFRAAVEVYYRKFIGAGGVLDLTGSSNVRMRNNHMRHPSEIEFEASGQDVAW